ncbi:MAG: AmmeMemoRadiSam system protein B [Candidatus Omnitrophica bacterium]|nr:AmmeMemoRadiSam system protein B [Candidatus Omnitrophota bacterium]MCM8790496.1 AmmeMemoRadiSam system protein B [Candidatus Omnitrophota bacterium]
MARPFEMVGHRDFDMKKPLLITLSLFIASVAFASDVKDADLAGSWYAASGMDLERELRGYLDAAQPDKIDGDIFAVIAPHAGYKFSGAVAAYSFKAAKAKKVNTVVLIGFTHRLPFDGISIYDRGSFRTPLGDISVDTNLASAIAMRSDRIFFYPRAFSDENSIEMEIPFIQLVFKGASIVPIAFGTQSYNDAVILADALAAALRGRDDVLVVASTDMSHYHPYAKANEIDAHAISLIENMKAKELYDEARLGICELCGLMPVTATILAAQRLGFADIKVLKYANSGDTWGDKSRVVGYLSAVIYRKTPATDGGGPVKEEESKMILNQSQKKRLLQIARESMTSFVKDGKRKVFNESDPVLNEPMGAFVTLREDGELRGCIGNMVAHGPLYKTVADMAIEAATSDPRFQPVSSDELDRIEVEVSVLSPLKKVASLDEIKIPGNGVLVRRGFRSGVYLPQVATETGWSKEEFMSSLCAHKAGLPADAWKDPSTEIYIFTAEVFAEKE